MHESIGNFNSNWSIFIQLLSEIGAIEDDFNREVQCKQHKLRELNASTSPIS